MASRCLRSRQLKSWNVSLQKKGCACKHSPFHSLYRKYPVAHPSPWYCYCGTYSSIALEFLSQYWLLSEGVGFICMFGGRSSENYYKKCQLLTLSSSWALRTLLSFERLLSACSNTSQVNAVNPEFLMVSCLQDNELTSFRGLGCLEMMHTGLCVTGSIGKRSQGRGNTIPSTLTHTGWNWFQSCCLQW